MTFKLRAMSVILACGYVIWCKCAGLRGHACHLQQEHADAVGVKEVGAADLPRERGHQRRKERQRRAREALGHHQLLRRAARVTQRILTTLTPLIVPIWPTHREVYGVLLHKPLDPLTH